MDTDTEISSEHRGGKDLIPAEPVLNQRIIEGTGCLRCWESSQGMCLRLRLHDSQNVSFDFNLMTKRESIQGTASRTTHDNRKSTKNRAVCRKCIPKRSVLSAVAPDGAYIRSVFSDPGRGDRGRHCCLCDGPETHRMEQPELMRANKHINKQTPPPLPLLPTAAGVGTGHHMP